MQNKDRKVVEEITHKLAVSNQVRSSIYVINTETDNIKALTVEAEDLPKIEKGSNDLKSIIENYSQGKNKFLDDFNIQILYLYLDNLSLLEESAFLHILAFLIILGCMFSIISVFFGNEVIRYLNLEVKYPKLAVYLKIRATFQRYYLIWNILIIIAVSIISLFLNL